MMNCTPFVRQYDILNNKWGAVHMIRISAFLFSDEDAPENSPFMI